MNEQSAPWWALVASAVPSLGVGVWTFMQWWSGRQDKKEDRGQTASARRDEMRFRDAEADRATATAINARLMSDYQRMAAERDVAASKAAFWETRARRGEEKLHDFRHAALNARQVAANAATMPKVDRPLIWAENLDLPVQPQWTPTPDQPSIGER